VIFTFAAEDTDGEIETTTISVTINGEFTPMNTGLPNITSASAVWGDADNDGDLDLLLGGEGTSAIWRNSAGTFGTNVIAQFAEGSVGDVSFIDVNNDGNLDAFVTGGTGASHLYIGNSGGAFQEVVPPPMAQLTYSAVAWGDADNDGDVDALLMGIPSLNPIDFPQMYTYVNWGAARFAGSRWYNPALRDGAAAWVDIDNDGDNELIVTGSTTFNASGAQRELDRRSGAGV